MLAIWIWQHVLSMVTQLWCHWHFISCFSIWVQMLVLFDFGACGDTLSSFLFWPLWVLIYMVLSFDFFILDMLTFYYGHQKKLKLYYMTYSEMFSVSVVNPGWDSSVDHYNPCWNSLSLLCFHEPEVLYRREWSYSGGGCCIFLAVSFGSLHQGLVLSMRLTQHQFWSLRFLTNVSTSFFGFLIWDIVS